MSENSKIEWTDATWNPVRGCTKISPGCAHCYAETFAERWRGIPGHAYEQGFDLRLVPEKLAEPLKWKKPRKVFVNSMSDLFQNGVPNNFIDKAVAVMALAHWHTFQVLTKRASQMYEYFLAPDRHNNIELAADAMFPGKGHASFGGKHVLSSMPLSNVHLGVSVEDRKYGFPRIDCLRQTKAAVRWLSIEPLLEDLGEINLKGIDWVVVGSESGHGRRSMETAWAESIEQQCRAEGVKFFMKQMVVSGKVSGDIETFPLSLRVREMPNIAAVPT